MAKKSPHSALGLLSCFVLIALLAACGDSDDEMEFEGAVRNSSSAAVAPGAGLSGVSVCALGKCSVTDANGEWDFRVDEEDFDGGSALFTVSGPGINDTIEVRGIDDETEVVTIEFEAAGDGDVRLTLFKEDDVEDDLDDEVDEEADDLGDEVEDEADDLGDDIEEEVDDLT